MDGYKISSELFLYLLSNLPEPSFTERGSSDFFRVVFDDEVLIKEVTSWKDIVIGGSLPVTRKVDIGPFYGIFPFSLEFSETPSERTATVDFSIDFYDWGKGLTWKDWFILEEDKYRMEVTRS